MRTVAIIQARMEASRLPGKVMELIGGKPMLSHVSHRVGQAQEIDEVVVATTEQDSDRLIEAWCKQNDIKCFRGSENDVLDRYYGAAVQFGADKIVRVTADCPFSDPCIVDQVVRAHQKSGVDYATNTMPYTWPDGFDVEVFSFNALEAAWKEAKTLVEREHVTPYMRKSLKCINVQRSQNSESRSWRMTVDHEDDLAYVRKVFAAGGGRPDISFVEIESIVLNSQDLIFEVEEQKHLANEGYYKTVYAEAKLNEVDVPTLDESEKLFQRAQQVVPGCAQTFSKSYLQHIRGVSPLFLEEGKGSHVWDADGNEYIDYIQGLLPNILGYACEEVNAAFAGQIQKGHSFSLPHRLEIQLAERLVDIIPCAEMVRFGKNGSDATSGAVRMARAYTGRERIACCGYHGWQDWFIGSTSFSLGVPKCVQGLTHPFVYNDLDSLRCLFERFPGEIAAVIMEPFNFVEPKPGYLESVKKLAHENGALLVFDEICSGFHFGLGGAQKLFGVIPDLACFGKAMANGFPLSAVVGRRDILKICEDVFFSFTFGGEVASMAAALKVIDILESTNCLVEIEGRGKILLDGVNILSRESGLGHRIKGGGRPSWSLLQFYDSKGGACQLTRTLFQQEVVKRGVLILATHNMTAAHSQSDLDKTLSAYADTFRLLADWLSDANPSRFLQGDQIENLFKARG